MIVFIILVLWLAIRAAKHKQKTKSITRPPGQIYTKHAITAARADIKALQAQKQTLQALANYLAYDAIPASESPAETIRLHSQLANTYSKLASAETKLNRLTIDK